jgi:hypothetical protein
MTYQEIGDILKSEWRHKWTSFFIECFSDDMKELMRILFIGGDDPPPFLQGAYHPTGLILILMLKAVIIQNCRQKNTATQQMRKNETHLGQPAAK